MIRGQVVDVSDFTNQKTSMSYPALLLTEPNGTTTTVLPNLEKGDLPLIVRFEGQERVLARVRDSAYTINMICRTHSGVTYLKDPNTAIKLSTVRDYLEEVF